MSQSKCFKELFGSVYVWKFFIKRGGLPNSKHFEELFCLCLDIFQKGRGLPKSKELRNFFASVLKIFR